MKDIPGYEGHYAITEDGKIWSYTRKSVRLSRLKNPWIHSQSGRWLKLHPDGQIHYLKVGLQKEGKVKYFNVYRLVATLFVENPDNLPHVNHKNGDKKDNRAENLE